ncbi:hypothetical protein GQ43DRAFT_472104 [Delitschia confertaspora ATCC 74209]|uniref:Uncharacterized protein n=1 Tax=Delitschia confertaspora ATCC 74209 TaxID=1513339 RepID=A0A9P4JQ75_9PLEO|nr:hypothetical protein GQ43DRAFT_472104 [Delitschia confertaspora ATCC 74209]
MPSIDLPRACPQFGKPGGCLFRITGISACSPTFELVLNCCHVRETLCSVFRYVWRPGDSGVAGVNSPSLQAANYKEEKGRIEQIGGGAQKRLCVEDKGEDALCLFTVLLLVTTTMSITGLDVNFLILKYIIGKGK